jgi:hypothetical protein
MMKQAGDDINVCGASDHASFSGDRATEREDMEELVRWTTCMSSARPWERHCWASFTAPSLLPIMHPISSRIILSPD